MTSQLGRAPFHSRRLLSRLRDRAIPVQFTIRNRLFTGVIRAVNNAGIQTSIAPRPSYYGTWRTTLVWPEAAMGPRCSSRAVCPFNVEQHAGGS